jgi:hypothetical protein
MVATLVGDLYVILLISFFNRNFFCRMLAFFMRQTDAHPPKNWFNFAFQVLIDHQHQQESKGLFGKHVYCTMDRTFQNFLYVCISCSMAFLLFVVFFVAWIF